MTPRLFLHIASIEARKRMSYRADFWISMTAGFAAEFGIVWFLWTALFAESGQEVIGGYDFHQMLVYYVSAILFAKIVRVNEFEGHVSQDIYEGGLNRYLVLPAPYVGFKYAQSIGSLLPAVLQLVVFGGAWAWLSGGRGAEGITLGGVAMCAGALLLGNLLYYAMSFSLHAVAFWADNVWSLLVALRFVTNLLGGLLFPLALFPQAIQDANVWLPFRSLFALPAEALLGRVELAAWAQAMGVGLAWLVVLAGIGRHVWRRGTLQYSGIGI